MGRNYTFWMQSGRLRAVSADSRKNLIFIICLLIISILGEGAFAACEEAMIKDNLVCRNEMNSIEKAMILSIFDKSSIYYEGQLPELINSRNEKISTKALYYRNLQPQKQAGAANSNSGMQAPETLNGESVAVLPFEMEKVDMDVLIEAEDVNDNKILKLTNLTYRKNMTLGVDKLPKDRDYISGRTELESYAINLENVDFSVGSLTAIAKGNMLWKCAAWNFTEQSCMGTWQLLSVISPGQEYSIALFPGDPGYVETYDDAQSLDIAMTALNEERIVIAWINNDTTFNASFEIWHTNGTLLLGQTDFETTGSAASRVDVEAINNTHFVLGLIDGPDQDLDFFIYDFWGNQVLGATQLDATIGAIADVAVCELGDRFAVLVENTGDGDADFYVRSNDGTSLVVQTAVDATTAPGAAGQNLIDCVALNNTRWVYLFYDDADNDVTNALVNGSGSILVAATDIDLDVGETGQIAGAAFRNSRYAAVFYDAIDQDISLRITQVTAANALQIIYTGDIDLTAGLDSRVAAAEVRNSNDSYIVAAWQDQGSGDIKAGVYNGSGAAITAPFTVTTSETAAYKLLDVIGYNSLLDQGLCNYTFAIAYTNQSGTSVFETYWLNGTRWNGTCPRASENVPPSLQILSPANNTENTTSVSIEFSYIVSDQSPISNCSLYINGEINITNTSVVRDSAQSFMLDMDNGQYTWEIECYDFFGNRNSSGLYNLNMSVFFYSSNAIDIDIDAFNENTLVMAWIDGGVGNILSFEVWNTNGTRVADRVDVDLSGDNSSAVSVAVLNKTNFVIGWIDGPDNDLSHVGYTISGQNYFSPTDLDIAIGANADVDVCAMGASYAIVNANGGDSDADYRIESNSGTDIVLESSVDITITPGANNQNLVACSAINNSAWAYAFFDDADNDASVATTSNAGATLAANLDVDLDVGETGQVAVAGLRNNTFAYVYYDSVAASVYLSIMQLNGATLNTILAPTAIDSGAGTESRVDVAEIEYFGRSYIVAGWYDSSDTTIKAAVYNASGNEVTAPFIVSSNPTPNASIVSLTGIHSALGTGLCRRTFAIAYTNSSGYAVFRTYYHNGTVWDGNCPPIASPDVGNINTEALISLNAGRLRKVECNATIGMGADMSSVTSVEGVLFRSNMSGTESADENVLYRNLTCAGTSFIDGNANYTCSFYLQYFAVNGSWNCTIQASNADAKNASNTVLTAVDTLYAFNTSTLYLDYGNISPGSNSSDAQLNLTNFGNMPVNITVRGFGGDDPSTGAGYALMCMSGQNITLNNERYATLSGRTFAQKNPLTASPVDLNITIPKQTSVGLERQNQTFWQLYVPPMMPLGECNGTVVFTATST